MKAFLSALLPAILLWLLIAFALAFFSPVFAQASVPCVPRDEIANMLAEKHGEALAYRAILNAQSLLELYVNEETGTWTATLVAPNGSSCWAGDGEAWQVITPLQATQPVGPGL